MAAIPIAMMTASGERGGLGGGVRNNTVILSMLVEALVPTGLAAIRVTE
jgi:hypothetical protein